MRECGIRIPSMYKIKMILNQCHKCKNLRQRKGARNGLMSKHTMELKEKQIYRTKEDISRLFKALHIRYLNRTRVAWEPLIRMDLEKSPYYIENITEFQQLSKRYGAEIEGSVIAPIYIKKINDTIGHGVFAAETIQKYDFIGEYTGVIQKSDAYDDHVEKGYESDFSWYFPDQIKDGPKLEINGRREGNEMRFLNHGDVSNVIVEHTLHNGLWVIFFKAAETIMPHEQLLIDYGEQYWDEDYRTKKVIEPH